MNYSFDPHSAPSLSFDIKNKLPENPGIYYVINRERKQILYIGKSVDLRGRWRNNNHHRGWEIKLIQAIHSKFKIYIAWELESGDLSVKERKRINQFKPLLNDKNFTESIQLIDEVFRYPLLWSSGYINYFANEISEDEKLWYKNHATLYEIFNYENDKSEIIDTLTPFLWDYLARWHEFAIKDISGDLDNRDNHIFMAIKFVTIYDLLIEELKFLIDINFELTEELSKLNISDFIDNDNDVFIVRCLSIILEAIIDSLIWANSHPILIGSFNEIQHDQSFIVGEDGYDELFDKFLKSKLSQKLFFNVIHVDYHPFVNNNWNIICEFAAEKLGILATRLSDIDLFS